VTKELRANVLPKYQAVPAYIKKKNAKGPWFRDELRNWGRYPDIVVWRNLARYERHTAIRDLSQALLDWGKKFNLIDDWLLDCALYTLSRWDRTPTGASVRDPKAWSELSQVPYEEDSCFSSGEDHELRFRNDGWYLNETWNCFEARVTKDFEEALAKYRIRLLELARERGYVRPPEIRNPKHFNWLARFQSAGESPKKVASALRVTGDDPANTILQAVKKTALMIGLSLRPGHKGNRRSPKT